MNVHEQVQHDVLIVRNHYMFRRTQLEQVELVVLSFHIHIACVNCRQAASCTMDSDDRLEVLCQFCRKPGGLALLQDRIRTGPFPVCAGGRQFHRHHVEAVVALVVSSRAAASIDDSTSGSASSSSASGAKPPHEDIASATTVCTPPRLTSVDTMDLDFDEPSPDPSPAKSSCGSVSAASPVTPAMTKKRAHDHGYTLVDWT